MKNSHLKQGYFLEFLEKNRRDRFDHYFCGPCSVPKLKCPSCGLTPLQSLSLDCRDTRLGLPNLVGARLPLLFCWRCPLGQSEFYYRLKEDNGVEWLSYAEGPASDDFPYEAYPRYFPGARVTLVPIKPSEQKIIHGLNHEEIDFTEHPKFSIPQHQVGGEPYMLQPLPEDFECPKCKDPMHFFAAIGDETLAAKGFTGNPFVQAIYHLCPACLILGAYQQCD